MDRLTRRRFATFAALATAALPRAARAQAQARLGVVWMGWPEEQVKALMDAFEASQGRVRLGWERIPFPEILQTLEVRLGARTPTPDLFMADGSLTSSYAVRGHLLDLTPQFGPEQQRFTQAAWAQGTYQDKLYTAPFMSSSQLMFVNLKLFEAAGVAPPEPDVAKRWTWDQIVEAGRKIADPSKDVWGFAFEQSERPYQLFPMMQSAGGTAISPDGFKVSGYVDAEPFVRGTQAYQDLFNRHAVSPKGIYDLALARELFATGRCGMFVGGTWCLDIFDARKDLAYAAVPHPYFAGGKPVTPTGSWHIGINPRSPNREAQLEFARWALSPSAQELWFKLRPTPPVLLETWRALAPSFSARAWTIVQYELANSAVPRPKTAGWREYESLFGLALRDVQAGGAVPPRMERLARDVDRELVKYRT